MIHAIGRMLRPARAGGGHLLIRRPAFRTAPRSLALASPAFAEGATMPARHTVEDRDLSPPLAWRGQPDATREFALVMQDVDAPLPRPLVHLIAFGIAADCAALDESALPSRAFVPHRAIARLGRNSLRHRRYDGPAPIPGHGPHRYVFQLFALDRPLCVAAPGDLDALIAAMTGAVLAVGALSGIYER